MELVTYEIGKKLQEKGYPHGYNRFGYRLIYSDECTIKYILNIGAYDEEYYGENIPCPTINEVLKWLLKEKGIYVNVDCSCHDSFKFFYTIYRKGEASWETCGFNDELYDLTEEAEIAGILHVLNKDLI